MVQKLIGGNIEDGEFVDIPGESEDITDLQNDIDSQMNRIFEEFGGDERDTEFRINVKRAITGKGELEHCFACTPAELPIIDRIQSQYGPGAYQIWIYKDGKIFKRRTLHIAKPLQGYAPAPQHVAQSGQQDLSQLINAMAESNRQTIEQMRSLITTQAQPRQIDIMGMITGAATILPKIKEIFTPQKTSSDLEIFMKAAEFMREMNGGDKESNFFDVVKTVAPSLMDLTSKLAANQNISPDPQMQPKTIHPHQTQSQGNPQMVQFRQQVRMLVAMAMADKDPALYADMILDNLPPEQIGEFVNRPDAIEYLISVEPSVQEVRHWFERLKGELILALTETEEGTDTIENNGTLSGETIQGHDVNATTEPETEHTPKGDVTGNTRRPRGGQ